MIKRFYLANGALLYALGSRDDDIAVDGSIAALLSTMHLGDYCYLVLLNGEDRETIKVWLGYEGLRVERAQDGTKRMDFPAGTRVVYQLTVAEIEDISRATTEIAIYGDGYGAATVAKIGASWVVNIPIPRVEGVGGVRSWTESEVGTVKIEDLNGMFGCCDAGVTGAPGIPGPYFYLTSKPYPTENVEPPITWLPKVGGSKGGTTPISPIGDIWQLEQPEVTEQYTAQYVELQDMELFGGAKIFTAVEQYTAQYVELQDMELFGGSKTFTNTELAIATSGYLLEMFLFGGAVTYTYEEEYMKNTTTLQSMELI